jgi:hypothetical protein
LHRYVEFAIHSQSANISFCLKKVQRICRFSELLAA